MSNKAERLVRLATREYGPRLSAYLSGGYREDEFEFREVFVGERSATALVDVNAYFGPSDGEFHLSGSMAMIWISQLSVIFTCYDNGMQQKNQEMYLRSFQLKCHQRVSELKNIPLSIEITAKNIRSGLAHYRSEFDIGDGRFTGKKMWYVPVEASG